MRISDWSSDVCSSDLSGQIYVDRKFDPESRARAQAFLTLITQGIGIVIGSNIAGYVYGLHTDAGGGHDWRAIWMVPAVIAFITLEIGRASCRARGCQSV